MAQFFEIHPESPQLRLIHRAVEILRKGGVIAESLHLYFGNDA